MQNGMNKTPRTDAVAEKAWLSATSRIEQLPASFARQLEIENRSMENYIDACEKWIRETVENCSVFSDPPRKEDYIPANEKVTG